MGCCCGPRNQQNVPKEINTQIDDSQKRKEENQNPSQPPPQVQVDNQPNTLKAKQDQIHVQKQEANEIQEIPMNDCNNQSNVQEIQFERRILFVGKSGVGKTSLFKQIKASDKAIISDSGFQEKISDKFVAVDTPAFEMDDSIEQREQVISLFQSYMEEHKSTITTFAIVVNFERTDLMKRKIADVYKYLQKFKEMIVIIVVDWQLSQDQERDKQHLEKQFKIYNQCNLCFIEKGQDQELLKCELSKIVLDRPSTPIDLKDTIFEKIQSNRTIQRELENLVKKIR